LVGKYNGGDSIQSSTETFRMLMEKIYELNPEKKNFTIEIVREDDFIVPSGITRREKNIKS
jgi:hypothetical protein